MPVVPTICNVEIRRYVSLAPIGNLLLRIEACPFVRSSLDSTQEALQRMMPLCKSPQVLPSTETADLPCDRDKTTKECERNDRQTQTESGST